MLRYVTLLLFTFFDAYCIVRVPTEKVFTYSLALVIHQCAHIHHYDTIATVYYYKEHSGCVGIAFQLATHTHARTHTHTHNTNVLAESPESAGVSVSVVLDLRQHCGLIEEHLLLCSLSEHVPRYVLIPDNNPQFLVY